jgi:hypothetical protein
MAPRFWDASTRWLIMTFVNDGDEELHQGSLHALGQGLMQERTNIGAIWRRDSLEYGHWKQSLNLRAREELEGRLIGHFCILHYT